MLCVPFRGKTPILKSGSRIAPNATLVGNVEVEDGASVWYGVVVRADNNYVHIGKNAILQDNTVVHCSEYTPVSIGEHVSIGHNAIIHSCTIEHHSLVGMGATLLDDCVIGHHSLIGANALVTQRTVIPPYSLVVGSPAKVKRTLTEKEIEMLDNQHLEYLELSEEQLEITP